MANKRKISAKEKHIETEEIKFRQAINSLEENLRVLREKNTFLEKENKIMTDQLKVLEEKYKKSLEVSTMKDEDITKLIKCNDNV